MDIITLQAYLLQVDGNEYLKQAISEQQEIIKALQDTNSHLNTVIITNEKRMIPNDSKEHYTLMLIFDSSSVLKLVKRLKDSWTRGF
jgi:hypothetical protein